MKSNNISAAYATGKRSIIKRPNGKPKGEPRSAVITRAGADLRAKAR